MTRFVRILRWLVVGLGVAVLVVVALLYWALNSESGTRTVWALAAGLVPEDVSVEAVEGRLSGPLTLRGIAYRSDSLSLDAARVRLEWQLTALIDLELHVERLEIEGVEAVSLPVDAPPPGEPPGEPFTLPERLDLPVDVVVDSLVLERVTYRTAPEAEPLGVERVELTALANDAELRLGIVEARGPLFALSGELSGEPLAPYALEGRLAWTVRPPGHDDIEGVTELGGSLELLHIEQRVADPYNLTAELSLDGSPGDLALGLDAEVDLPEFGTVTVALDGALAGDSLALETLALRHPGSGAELEGTGRLALGETPRLELAADWSALRWPLTGEPLVVSEAGSFRVEGSLDDYAIEVGADLVVRETGGRVELAGAGTSETVSLERIEIAALDGLLNGTAEVRFSPVIEASTELEFAGLDPGVLAPTWGGRLDGALSASARIEDEQTTARLGQLAVNGTLRERELELEAAGGYEGDVANVETLVLRSGMSELRASGTVGETVAVEASFDSENLADLWPGLAGRLSLSGAANGPLERPRVELALTGSEIAGFDAELASLDITADVDLAGAAESSLSLTASEGEAAGTRIEQVELMANGTAASHAVSLDTVTSQGAARLVLDGVLDEAWSPDFAWAFELGTADFEPAALGPWRLAAPAGGRVRAASLALEPTCWTQEQQGEFCLEASRSPERARAAFSLAALPFDYAAPLAAEPIDIEGEVSAEGEVTLPAGGPPSLDVTLSSTEGRLVPISGEDAAIAFGPLSARFDSAGQTLDAELSLPVTEDGTFELIARLGAGTELMQRPLTGRLTTQIDELGFLAELTDQISNVRGRVDGDLELAGTLGDPSLSGRLVLSEAGAVVPATNIELENVMLTLSGDAAGDLQVEASAESGGGSLTVGGRLELLGAGPRGELTATGEAFEAVNTPDAWVRISPELDLLLDDERIELTGAMRVPEASITPRGTGSNAVGTSPDEVIVTEDGASEQTVAGRPVFATVQLALGEDVTIEASGLNGELGGSIEIVESPGEPTRGTGELRVSGTYTAYGQELQIRTGRLLFAGGPIMRPGLDIEAVRRPEEDILVGARVRGTLEQPELTLFSEPSMRQQEQLSYLVLGRPLTGASSSEGSALSRAALALGLRGGSFVSERINENLGLDEFGIQTQPGQAAERASFVIGKYLSPSLYVSYAVGLFEPVNTLHLRYTITEHWRLLTESSTEGSGGDIVYSIERSSSE